MLSPIEIRKQEFKHSFRGYDPEEVRSFLESVASEMERMLEQVRIQGAEIERLQAELSSYRRMEETMREALVNAQEALKDAREGAHKEAQLIHREAELIAERIINDARQKAEELRKEIEDLNTRRQVLARRLKQLLTSELEMIQILTNSQEWEQDITTAGKESVPTPSVLRKSPPSSTGES
ncbi:MAG: DivIVA domain-containing protein [bacterium]